MGDFGDNVSGVARSEITFSVGKRSFRREQRDMVGTSLNEGALEIATDLDADHHGLSP